MIEFLKTLYGNKFFFYSNSLFFLPSYFKYFFKIISTEKAKSKFLKIHLKKFDVHYLEKRSKQFSKTISKFYFPDAKKFLCEINHEKCIVSASLDIWMIDIAKELGCKLICTKTIFKNGFFYDIGTNCSNEKKVIEIKKKFDLKKYSEIHVFGNSEGDKKMLDLGTNKYYKYFK